MLKVNCKLCAISLHITKRLCNFEQNQFKDGKLPLYIFGHADA